MSTCLNLVARRGNSAVIRRIVCRLSHWIVISWPGLSRMTSNRRFHHRTSLAVCDGASDSASVLEVVTVFCLVERQSIGLPNSLNRCPSVLYLVTGSSTNGVSLAQVNTCRESDAENSIAIV